MAKVKIVTVAEHHSGCSQFFSFRTYVLPCEANVLEFVRNANKKVVQYSYGEKYNPNEMFFVTLICVHEEETNGG